MRSYIAILLAFTCSAFASDGALPVVSVDALQRAATGKSTASVIPKPTRVIVGEPTSSLSKNKAIEAAKLVAATIPGAMVADIDKSYDGRLAPAISANAIVVVEPVDFSGVNAFDLVLYLDPSGQIRARRILAKGSDFAVVGYELNDETSADVAAKSFIGRIVCQVVYNPKTP